MAAEGKPVSVEPSGKFLGADGDWSTFFIRVGNPRQTLQVLASTQVPEMWLVDPQGCNDKDPSNCTEARGGIYQRAESSTSQGSSGGYDNVPLQAESNLGMTKNSDVGSYGFDAVELGRPGDGNISLSTAQVIATVATKDFLLGNLGLSARRVSTLESGKPPGLLTSLNDRNYIPSLSYGYTAGAAYQKSNASLTFGGFDRSKLTPNDVEFSLATPETRELMVELESVVSTDPKGIEKSLLVKPIPMLLDSTVSHIWLPVDTCKRFESAFGLDYDPISNFYYVDNKLHDQLTKQIANITFALRAPEADGPVVNITLPYASFDLDITSYHPEAKRPSKYFPLRQAHDESQYILGRALFQELYLTVNYETDKFFVYQALHAPDKSSNIVPIPSAQATETGTNPTNPGSEPNPPIIMTTTPEPSPKSRALATPAIAGIAIAVVILALLVGGFLLYRHRRKRKAKRLPRGKAELPADPPFPHHARELDGSERHDPQKGVPGVTVEEKDQAQMDQNEVLLMGQGDSASHGPSELPSPDPFRPELPPNQDSYRSELPSTEHCPRSELSTPEPIRRSELSTPEPGWQGSPELEDVAVRESSPPLEGVPSPVSLASSLWSGTRRREPVLRKDSSESEAGWQRTEGIGHSRPPLRHSRMVSSGSESSFRPKRVPSGSSRPTHVRVDSSESESGGVRGKLRSRPPHQRLDSNDSVITMETRLAMNPPGSFLPPRPGQDRQDRPLQSLSSIGPDPSPLHRQSHSLESMRSGLLSPAPLEFVDEREARDFSPPKQRSGDHPPPKEADRS